MARTISYAQLANVYRLGVLALLAGAGLLAFASLGGVPEPEHPLRVGTNHWVGYEPLHLAKAEGLLPAEVTLLKSHSTATLMEAMKLGTIDAAGMTADEALRLGAEGVDLTVVLVLDVSDGADVVLGASAARAAQGLTPGSRIGVESSAVGGYVLHRYLQKSGIDPGALEIVEVPAADHRTAFAQHRLDFLVTYEPLATEAQRRGAARVFDSTALPGEIVDVLAVRTSALARHPKALRGLIDAWFDAKARMSGLPADWPPEVAQGVERRQGAPLAEVALMLARIRFPDRDANRALLRPDGLGRIAVGIADWLRAEGVDDIDPATLRLTPDYLGGP